MLAPGKVYYGHNTDIYVIDSSLVAKYTWNKCEISTVYSWNRFNVNRTYEWDRYSLDTTHIWNEYELTCDWDPEEVIAYDRNGDSLNGIIAGTVGLSYTVFAKPDSTVTLRIDNRYTFTALRQDEIASKVTNPSYCSIFDGGTSTHPLVSYECKDPHYYWMYRLEPTELFGIPCIKRTKITPTHASAGRGSYIGQRTSDNASAYPNDGIYIPSGERYGSTYTIFKDTEYARGDFDGEETSSSWDAYPSDGRSGSTGTFPMDRNGLRDRLSKLLQQIPIERTLTTACTQTIIGM